jgi:hypothetical protein
MKALIPFVGMKFRPPALRILAELPFGAKLLLQRDPENLIYPNVVKVLLPDFTTEGPFASLLASLKSEAIPDHAELSCGQWYASQLTSPFHLGYISAKTGHATIMAESMDGEGLKEVEGTLSALHTGNPAVEIDCSAEAAALLTLRLLS